VTGGLFGPSASPHIHAMYVACDIAPPTDTRAHKAAFDAARIAYWDDHARHSDSRCRALPYYKRRLAALYRQMVVPGQSVLELGCGHGTLLAQVAPRYGLGIDFSSAMIDRARHTYGSLTFECADAHAFRARQTFDYILISDLINDVWDVQQIFETAAAHSHSGTRVIINYLRPFWTFCQQLATATHLTGPRPPLTIRWLAFVDVSNMLTIAGLETIRHSSEIMCPIEAFGVEQVLNRYLVKTGAFKWLACTTFVIARPRAKRYYSHPTVSIIVPARNEAGNIKSIFDRVPPLGTSRELIFVEGHSRDGTYERIAEEIANHPQHRARLFRQSGEGKGDAVRLGCSKATGELLMLLDADLTVAPEELTRFYQCWLMGFGELINGVRLLYPTTTQAMRLLNRLGNIVFSQLLSVVLQQRVHDGLCGTKVLTRDNYQRITASMPWSAGVDPFGDFDILLGAAKYGLKLIDLPVRYSERTYGTTNIHRWRDGWALFRMLVMASRHLMFI
jgi:2-polyprenyl-3-methyl-5-hydroxy-6-metoxy-1,4-benzoquinol methylase